MIRRMRLTTILTPEQAGLLYDLVKEHRVAIVQKWALGIYYGLLVSLSQIDRSGGALLRGQPTVLDYFSGGDPVEATIIPASTHIAWLGVEAVPGPFWEPVGMLREVDLRSMVVYRARNPLAIVPLPAAVLPLLPLK